MCVCIGVDLKRPSGGRVVPTVGTFPKIRVSKSHFKALKNNFLGN